MPYRIERNRGRCKWAVVNEDSGETVGCHDTRDAAQRHMTALYANVPDARKALYDDDEYRPFDELLADEEFWAEYERMLTEVATPIFEGVYIAGARFASSVLGIAQMQKAVTAAQASSYFGSLQELSEHEIRNYAPAWADQVGRTTYGEVQEAVIAARREGTGSVGVLNRIGPMFDRERAERIAVTETTRLYGRGATATYEAMGATMWEWTTVADDAVDPDCDALNGDQFPFSTPFDPQHPNCRCMPLPVTEVSVKPVDEAIHQASELSADEVASAVNAAQSDDWGGRTKEDLVLRRVADMQGFTGAPRLVTNAEMDALVQSGHTELWRGLSAKGHVEAFKTGDYYAGYGIFGNGTYTGARSTAVEYAAGKEDQLLRMALRPNAKTITADDLQDKVIPLLREHKGTPLQKFYSDPGRAATALGYDAVLIPQEGFTLVLNRSALAVVR